MFFIHFLLTFPKQKPKLPQIIFELHKQPSDTFSYSNAAVAEHRISRINLVLTSMILINSKGIRISTSRENWKIKHFTKISEICLENFELQSYLIIIYA